MTTVVLRVRLVDGDRLDITYDAPGLADADDVVEQAVTALADSSGSIRALHGERTFILYGRGVAALEVAPRGAVL